MRPGNRPQRGTAQGDELPRAKAESPPGHTSIADGLGGSYFIPTSLKEKYDRLTNRVKALEAEMIAGQISEADAKSEIRWLRTELESARKEIDAQKKFVSAAKINTQSETVEFELGEAKNLLILADKVKLVGWDQPGVKCVLEKTVLGIGDEVVNDQFDGIKLVHRHGPAAEHVGKSPEEAAAEEQKFLASADGQKLDAKQLEARRKLVEQIAGYQQLFRPLQGKTLDTISIAGLSYADGNRQITLELSTPGGGASHKSEWRRHATLTVYVPTCNAVGLQGGLAGLDAQGLKTQLVVRGEGNRDYYGSFGVSDHQGSVTIHNIPLQSLKNVQGNVVVVATAYLGNSGVRHADDTKTSYVELPEPYVYSNIQGDFRGWFVRANLSLSGVTGTIDVNNEFGDTLLTVTAPLVSAAQRVVSQAGNIRIQLAKNALGKLPLMVLTETGTIRCGRSEPPLEDVSFHGYADAESASRMDRLCDEASTGSATLRARVASLARPARPRAWTSSAGAASESSPSSRPESVDKALG